jgi:hypothetical protein
VKRIDSLAVITDRRNPGLRGLLAIGGPIRVPKRKGGCFPCSCSLAFIRPDSALSGGIEAPSSVCSTALRCQGLLGYAAWLFTGMT